MLRLNQLKFRIVQFIQNRQGRSIKYENLSDILRLAVGTLSRDKVSILEGCCHHEIGNSVPVDVTESGQSLPEPCRRIFWERIEQCARACAQSCDEKRNCSQRQKQREGGETRHGSEGPACLQDGKNSHLQIHQDYFQQNARPLARKLHAAKLADRAKH